jgi:hypothetical protein
MRRSNILDILKYSFLCHCVTVLYECDFVCVVNIVIHLFCKMFFVVFVNINCCLHCIMYYKICRHCILKFEGFWRWCFIIRDFFGGRGDFVHCLNYKIIKLQRFVSWTLLPSSGKKGEEDTESLSVGPPGFDILRPGRKQNPASEML